MKEQIRKESQKRVRAIFKTKVKLANQIQTINRLAILVVTYSFNIINWNLSDIKEMHTKIRKLLTSSRMHHPNADVERLYVLRNEGGRGLIDWK